MTRRDAETRIAPRLGHVDRFLAWLVTGPIGRLAAFVADVAAYAWSRARSRRQ